MAVTDAVGPGRRRWRYRGRRDGPGDGPGVGGVAAGAAIGAANLLARIVGLVAALVALVIVAGIAFVVLDANTSNSIVSSIHDAAKFLVGPFDGIFKPGNHKLAVVINWGLAAAVYLVVGRLIAGLLRR
jgi:hypothetical protein